MREIKYKVYYKQELQGYERLGKTGWEWMCIEFNPDNGERWMRGVFPNNENYKRFEYTGLKDKNGVEIYEGDVLESFPKPDVRFTVEQGWSTDGLYGWLLRSHYSEKKLYSLDKSCLKMQLIGNIYSNPELLTLKPE